MHRLFSVEVSTHGPELALHHAESSRRNTVVPNSNGRASEPYVLATGETADYRLRLLHRLYGQGTRRVLLEAGLMQGMRVADLGCGVGMVTAMLAGNGRGPRGTSSASTPAPAQVAQANAYG